MHTPQTTVIFILVFACFHCNSAEILPQLHKLCLTLDIEKGMVMYILFVLLEYPPVIYCCRNYTRELVDPICWDGTDKPIMSIQALHNAHIRESVDSLCRDGSGPPIVCVHWKAVLTHERSCSKPFWTPSYPIRTFLYSMIPPK